MGGKDTDCLYQRSNIYHSHTLRDNGGKKLSGNFESTKKKEERREGRGRRRKKYRPDSPIRVVTAVAAMASN